MRRIFLLLFIVSSLNSKERIIKQVVVEPEPSIKDLTSIQVINPQIDIVFHPKKIIAVTSGQAELEYKLTGETPMYHKVFGNMAFIETNKNLIALSINSANFSVQPLFGDTNIQYVVSNSLIIVVTSRKIYIYGSLSGKWMEIDKSIDTILSFSAFDRTGTIITNERIITYSEYRKEPGFYSLNSFIPIFSYTVFDTKIVFKSTNKTIIYYADKGEFNTINLQ